MSGHRSTATNPEQVRQKWKGSLISDSTQLALRKTKERPNDAPCQAAAKAIR